MVKEQLKGAKVEGISRSLDSKNKEDPEALRRVIIRVRRIGFKGQVDKDPSKQQIRSINSVTRDTWVTVIRLTSFVTSAIRKVIIRMSAETRSLVLHTSNVERPVICLGIARPPEITS